jgi:MFS family permease
VLTLTGDASVALLVVNSFVTGVVLAVDSPTRHALLPALVSRAQLTSAISLNSAVFSGAGLIGPAIAGALIPAIGVGGIFVVNAVSYLIVIWALTQLEGVPQMSDRARVPGSVVGTIARGVGYVRRDALIGALLLLSILSGLLGRSVGALLPVFARDVYGVGSVAFGFLAAAPGLGTLVGSIWLASRAKVGAKGRWVVLTTLGLSLALLAFAWSRWYPVSLPLLAGLGLCASIGSGLIATLIQLRVPDELRGRVMGLFVLTLIGVPSLGSLLAGAVAEVVGVRETVAGSAALLALLTLLAYGRGRALRDAD